MAHIRTWADIEERGGDKWLTPAEKKLIGHCQRGELCELGPGNGPTQRDDQDPPSPHRHIRADVLRYLILGGCKACTVSEIGVRLSGAFVTGRLDLDYCEIRGALDMQRSHFKRPILSRRMTASLINFDGSKMAGWFAQGLEVSSSLWLRDTEHKRRVILNGSKIGGQLSCRRSKFDVPDRIALNLQNLTVGGHLLLSDMQTNATIFLMSAEVGGQVSFANSTLSCHNTGMRSKDITDTLALQAQSLKCKDVLIWRNVDILQGGVQLISAQFNSISTDFKGWPNGDSLKTDGMTYNRLSVTKTSNEGLLKWVAAGSFFEEQFRPQPYTQLAKVLRAMGHDKDARGVLERREEMLHKDTRARMRAELDPPLPNYVVAIFLDFLSALHWVFADKALKLLIGYGHRPFRSLLWLASLWSIAVWLAHMAWVSGDFAPASDVFQSSYEWRQIAASDVENPAQEWSVRVEKEGGQKTYVSGQDWSTFNRYAYAADLVIPIIDLGQTDTWGPSTERGDWGRRLWRYGFFLQVAGWIITALGAAAITGLIRRD